MVAFWLHVCFSVVLGLFVLSRFWIGSLRRNFDDRKNRVAYLLLTQIMIILYGSTAIIIQPIGANGFYMVMIHFFWIAVSILQMYPIYQLYVSKEPIGVLNKKEETLLWTYLFYIFHVFIYIAVVQ